MARSTMAASIRDALGSAMAADPQLVLFGEAVGRLGGAGGSTDGLAARHPDRVVDTPTADRGTLGVALGAAVGGRRTVVELAGPGRLLACAEVLAEAAEIATTTEFEVPLLVRVPYGEEAGPRLDRAAGAALANLPGLTVCCASGAASAGALTAAALRATGPVVLLEPRALYRTREDADGVELRLDRARVLRTGAHVTLVAWGRGVAGALAAASSLDADGISADVIDLVSLSPVDVQTVGERVRATGRVVVAGDDGAFASAALNIALHEAFLYLESPPARAGIGAEAIARAARDAVHY